jgi:hypothetical protein
MISLFPEWLNPFQTAPQRPAPPLGAIPERIACCVNLSNNAFTQYSNYDFNSFARIGDTIFAANESGIYSLDDSDTDNGTPIGAFFETPATDFGISLKKNFTRAYIGYESPGQLLLTMIPDGNLSNSVQYTFPNVSPYPGSHFHQDFIDLGAFEFARYWKARIDNIGGCYFGIDALSLACPSVTEEKSSLGQVLLFFKDSDGLNNRIIPSRIQYDPKTGMIDLSACSNIAIDDTGFIERREGYTLREAGIFHSLQSDGELAYAVQESGALVRVYADGSIATVVSGLTQNLPVQGTFLAGMFFWSNGEQNGIVADTTNMPWMMLPPAPGEIIREKAFSSPPITSGPMCVYNGRIYLADGPVLWHTEYISVNRIRFAVNFHQFESPIRMLAPVSDGIYASGDTGGSLKRKEIFDYPAISGTASFSVLKKGSQLMGTNESFETVFATTQGVCTGGPGGAAKNLTRGKIIFPPISSGAGIVISKQGIAARPQRFLCTLNP